MSSKAERSGPGGLHPRFGVSLVVKVAFTRAAEAVASGCHRAVLATGLREARSIALKVFGCHGFGLVLVDSRGAFTWVMQPRPQRT